MRSKRIFGAHWLAFLKTLKGEEGVPQLHDAASIAGESGCKLFELACSPINNLTPRGVANAMKGTGIEEVSYCRFYPDGYGDPLGDDAQVTRALKVFSDDVVYIESLRQMGLTVRFMTGPSCFVLAKKYTLGRLATRGRIRDFYGKVGDIIAEKDLIVGMEYLRPGEDQGAIGGMEEACAIIDLVGNPQIGIHGDVYHMLERGEVPHEAIEMAGDRLVYLHAHGHNRVVPGNYVHGDAVATDVANWHLIGKALDAIEYAGPIVPEPFGQGIRDEISALGEGLPPAIEADTYYREACTHLFHEKIIPGTNG